jgi:hypothetical protein
MGSYEMTYFEKIDQSSIDYKNGVRFALIQLMNMANGYKIKEDNISVPLNIYLKALYDDLDLFIQYGDNVNFAYENHDKKGIPTKAVACLSIRDYLQKKQREKIRAFVDILAS